MNSPETAVGDIIFQKIRVASSPLWEDAHLVWVEDALAAVLVPADQGWYLHCGMGRWEREGLFFATLDAAEQWFRIRPAAQEQ